MLARVFSAAVNGVDTYTVEVEVNYGYGDTFIALVGLPDLPKPEKTGIFGFKAKVCRPENQSA
ncbi:MAG TPA: hypothetical protein VK742_17610 [Candidatus Sulfotelmatobacter sp.]|jgi:hypothetical protein|nr:hypothetical protein [Candidatus Sulfotelmatobacter sp.]